MPTTPVFGLPFEDASEQPGYTLTGGSSGLDPILAEAVEAAIATINASIQTALDALSLSIDEINDRFVDYAADLDGASTTSEVYTGTSIVVPSAQNPTGTRFKIEAHGHLASSVDNDQGDLRIRRGTTTGDPLVVSSRRTLLRSAASHVSLLGVDDPPPGDVTYGMFIARTSGTGTVSMSSAAGFQGRMIVEWFDEAGT